jgi:hypothetical protein
MTAVFYIMDIQPLRLAEDQDIDRQNPASRIVVIRVSHSEREGVDLRMWLANNFQEVVASRIMPLSLA